MQIQLQIALDHEYVQLELQNRTETKISNNFLLVHLISLTFCYQSTFLIELHNKLLAVLTFFLVLKPRKESLRTLFSLPLAELKLILVLSAYPW